MSRRLRMLAALLALATLHPSLGHALVAADSLPAPGDSLRWNPAIRSGRLSNGMRYMILQNAWPDDRGSVRLAVNIGSTGEDDDQQGFAHFAEHMNFNGSTHFKSADDLVAYLRSVGLRFGPDANAYTSFDETVYMLDIPTDRDSLLDRGLLALSDFAGRGTFSEAEIQGERGVVLEEWRRGRGAFDRIIRKFIPVALGGSRYAERLPIGKPEIIEKGSAARLRDFYTQWYTPERMMVIAVGDFTPDRIDALVRSHFGSLPARPKALPTPKYDVPSHPDTRIAVATDPEAPSSSVAIYFKHERRRSLTVADFRRRLADRIFLEAFSARLGEIEHRANAPFLAAQVSGQPLGRSLDALVLGAQVADGGIERGLAGLLEEVARVRQHGFLESEVHRAVEQVSAENERAWAERAKTESNGIAADLVASFLYGNVAPGIEESCRLTRLLLPAITVKEVNGRTLRVLHNDNRAILAVAPEKAGVPAPREDSLRAIVERAGAATVTAWVDQADSRKLPVAAPRKDAIKSRRTIPEIGTTVLTLSNGAEVWLKPTDFKSDEIGFTSYAPGGGSVVDSTEYIAALVSPLAVNDGGVGGFKSTELKKLLAGKIVTVNAVPNPYAYMLNGSCRPADLETALQLVVGTFTQPTPDTAGFNALRERFASILDLRANVPEQVFEDTAVAVNAGNFYMDRVPTAAGIRAVRLERALALHQRGFGNAADFTFFFVGAFQVDSVAPLIARYLAGLPSTGKKTAAFVPRAPRFPKDVRKSEVRKGLEPKSQTRITWFDESRIPDPLENELESFRGRIAASILQDHLREVLREALGGTYSATASFNSRIPLDGSNSLSINFGSAPDSVSKLVTAALEVVRKLRDEGPSASDLSKVQEVERRELETREKQNTYWTASLQTLHQLGRDPRRMIKRRERIDQLTREAVHEAFRRFLPAGRYTVITLLPEAKPATPTPP